MEHLQDIIKRLGDPDQAVAFQAYHVLLHMVSRLTQPGKEEARAEIAAALAKELETPITHERNVQGDEKTPAIKIRNKVLRLLSYVATAKEVPAIVKTLDDPHLREMARFALDRNTSPHATLALIQALDSIGPVFRAGIVSALGQRQGPGVVAALRKAAHDDDREVRLAAITALANFAEPAHDMMIAKAAEGKCGFQRAIANKARVRLAETLRKAGKTDAAKRIYAAIRTSKTDAPQKKAAEIGLKALA